MKIKNTLKICAVAFLLIIIIITTGTKSTEELNKAHQNNIDTETEDIYCVIIENDNVCLTRNGKILKKYEIELSALPSYDISRLYTGIRVSSESEADSIAEDFDG